MKHHRSYHMLILEAKVAKIDIVVFDYVREFEQVQLESKRSTVEVEQLGPHLFGHLVLKYSLHPCHHSLSSLTLNPAFQTD